MVLLVAACASCAQNPTTLLVHIDVASGTTIAQLSINIDLGTGARVTRTLATNGGAPRVPGDVLVVLPNLTTTVDVALVAVDDHGANWSAAGSSQSQPHHQEELSLTLGPGALDLSFTGDGPLNGGDGGSSSDGPSADLPPLQVTTLSILAGENGGQGDADGVGTNARFNGPEAVAISGSTLYLVDQGGELRQVDLTTQTVSTIPLVDQGGNPFGFNYPQGLAYDPMNKIFYVASTNEELICQVKMNAGVGTVSFLAGTRYMSGSADGLGNSASFKNPQGLALDTVGNLWIADSGNGTVRMLQLSTAAVSTPAGTAGAFGWVDAPGPAAKFRTPNALAFFGVDLYVTDGQGGGSGNGAIRMLVVSPSPSPAPVSTYVGTSPTMSSMDGTLAMAGFGDPVGIAFDSTSAWVVDTHLNNVRHVTPNPSGMVTTIAGDHAGAGGYDDGNGTAARFVDPRFIALAPDGSNAWITDDDEYVLRKMSLTTPFAVSTVAGAGAHFGVANASGTSARFNEPTALVAAGPDAVYVTEFANNTIRKVTVSTGAVSTVAGGGRRPPPRDGQGTNSTFAQPVGLAVDNSGNLFVSDSDTSVLRQITFSGGVANVVTIAGTRNMTGNVDGVGKAALFSTPAGLAFDGDHTLFIADTDEDTIRTYDTQTGMVTTIAGVAGMYGGKNGPGLMAHFASPLQLAYDRVAQKLYVSESSCDIRLITFNPVTVARLTGNQGQCGHDDGSFANATFERPQGMAFDAGGAVLWVADTDESTVRRLDLVAQTVTTPIGVPRQAATLPGPLPAELNTPWGLALVPAGLVISSFNENVLLLAH